MKELLIAAADIIDSAADAELEMGHTENAYIMNECAAALTQLAKTAELRDELWAAAIEADEARNAWNASGFSTIGSNHAVFEQVGRANLRMENICRKVAEAEPNKG